MKEPRFPVAIDLTRSQFSNVRPHIIHRAVDPEIIVQREDRRNVNTLYQQLAGLSIGVETLGRLHHDRSIWQFIRPLTTSAIGTAWHLGLEGPEVEVTRRQLKTKRYHKMNPGDRPNAEALIALGFRQLQQLIPRAKRLIAHREKDNLDLFEVYKYNLGKSFGNVALMLASAEIADRVIANPFIDSLDMQTKVRDHGLGIINYTEEFGLELGALPSLAHLAEQHGSLAYHVHNNAPFEVRSAYSQAMDEELTP